MTLEQTIQSVPFMSVDDRLRLADAIWDSFGETDTPPLTPTQRSELDRRMADHDADPSTALNEMEVEARQADLRCLGRPCNTFKRKQARQSKLDGPI